MTEPAQAGSFADYLLSLGNIPSLYREQVRVMLLIAYVEGSQNELREIQAQMASAVKTLTEEAA